MPEKSRVLKKFVFEGIGARENLVFKGSVLEKNSVFKEVRTKESL